MRTSRQYLLTSARWRRSAISCAPQRPRWRPNTEPILDTLSLLAVSGAVSILACADRLSSGGTHEWCTCAGWNPQGRVRADLGRQARAMGSQRSPLRGVGDLPCERFSRRPEPYLRVSVIRLVWSGDSTLRRRREDLAAGRQQVRVRRGAGDPSVV